VKLVLKKPIRLGESTPEITELVFRDEVVSGDLRGIKQSSLVDPLVDDILKIAGRLCAQPDAVMSRLSPEDFGEVLALVNGFFKVGPPTGPTA
jgi:hypothetical protein